MGICIRNGAEGTVMIPVAIIGHVGSLMRKLTSVDRERRKAYEREG
jgi:hypothetical protein